MERHLQRYLCNGAIPCRQYIGNVWFFTKKKTKSLWIGTLLLPIMHILQSVDFAPLRNTKQWLHITRRHKVVFFRLIHMHRLVSIISITKLLLYLHIHIFFFNLRFVFFYSSLTFCLYDLLLLFLLFWCYANRLVIYLVDCFAVALCIGLTQNCWYAFIFC